MADRDSRVVGYFACLSPTQVVCTGVDACVVSGSADAMQEYVAELHPKARPAATVKKTRFGEILRGLEAGGAYAFDKESYARFYPLALEAGLAVKAADFDRGPSGRRFLTLRLVTR
jgi:hypothetical protein